jgi:hypothetical protein
MGMGSLGGAEFFAAIGARWYRLKARVRGFGRRVRDWGIFGPTIVVLLTVALAATCMAGCGGASAETRAAYSLEAARCVSHERAIVDRQGSTREQDEADLAAERARCGAALRAIEAGGQ